MSRACPRAAAEAAIAPAGLTLGEIIEAYIDLYPSIQIFLQSPSPGETAIHDAPMDLSVSLASGPAWTKQLQRHWSRMNPRGGGNVGDVGAFTIYAADNVGVIAKTLTVNGGTLPLVKILLTR